MKVNEWSLDVRLPEKFLEGLTGFFASSKPWSKGFPEPVDGLSALLGQLAGSLVISKKVRTWSLPAESALSGTAGLLQCDSGSLCFTDFTVFIRFLPFELLQRN